MQIVGCSSIIASVPAPVRARWEGACLGPSRMRPRSELFDYCVLEVLWVSSSCCAGCVESVAAAVEVCLRLLCRLLFASGASSLIFLVWRRFGFCCGGCFDDAVSRPAECVIASVPSRSYS